MAGSGIKLQAECQEAFEQLMLHKLKFVVFRFNDKRDKVVLCAKGELASTFDDLKAVIDSTHAYYLFYDCCYTTKTENHSRAKVLFVTLSDDDHVHPKEKMLVSSTKDEVKRKCVGFAEQTTINEMDEFTEDNFIDIVSHGRTK